MWIHNPGSRLIRSSWFPRMRNSDFSLAVSSASNQKYECRKITFFLYLIMLVKWNKVLCDTLYVNTVIEICNIHVGFFWAPIFVRERGGGGEGGLIFIFQYIYYMIYNINIFHHPRPGTVYRRVSKSCTLTIC